MHCAFAGLSFEPIFRTSSPSFIYSLRNIIAIRLWIVAGPSSQLGF